MNKFEECVRFYRDIIELQVLFEIENLTYFDFGGSYLMIELKESNKPITNNNLCLRFNVTNFQETCNRLSSLGITVKIEHYEWGSLGRFIDPDGNKCSIKDSEKFEKQITDHKLKFL